MKTWMIAAISSLVLLVELVQGQLKPIDGAKCKLAYVFGGKGTTGPVEHNSTKKFCKTLKQTCCSEEDFQEMFLKWQDPKSNVTIRKWRINEFRQLLNLTKYLDDAEKNITAISNAIKNTKFEGDPACMSPAHIQGNFEKHQLIKVALVQFNTTARQCWNYTQGLMNALMCASCDYEARDFIDVNNK